MTEPNHQPTPFDRRALSHVGLIRHIGAPALRDRQEVDDFVQEVLARLYASPRRDFTDDELRAWVGAIARNTARSWNRRQRPHLIDTLRDIPLDAPQIDHTLEDRERWAALTNALNRLSEKDRELIRAYYLEERPYRDVLDRYGLTYEAFRARLSRARRTLRAHLVSMMTLGGLLDSTLKERRFGEPRYGGDKMTTTISTTASILIVAGALFGIFDAQLAQRDRIADIGLGDDAAVPVQWQPPTTPRFQLIADQQAMMEPEGDANMAIGWVTQAQAIHAGLNKIGVNHSSAWMMGGTGYAFVASADDRIGPASMYTGYGFKTEPFFRLGENLGYKIEAVVGMKGEPDFAEKQRAAWDGIRHALDAGHAAYAMSLAIPEYYVIHGYNDVGYLYSGIAATGEAYPWQKLGDHPDVGVLDVGWISPTEPAADVTTVRDALAFAVEFGKGKSRYAGGMTHTGLDAFDAWIAALSSDATPSAFNIAYNAQLWHECRALATRFLEEAEERIGTETTTPLFRQAWNHYNAVTSHLYAVTVLFPWEEHQLDTNVKDAARRAKAVEHLRAAKEAEAAGLRVLEALAKAL